MSTDPALADVHTLHQPLPDLVAELESLLDAARRGELRGLLFAGYSQGSTNYRYGAVGQYSLAEFAMGIKLLDIEFASIVHSRGVPDE